MGEQRESDVRVGGASLATGKGAAAATTGGEHAYYIDARVCVDSLFLSLSLRLVFAGAAHGGKQFHASCSSPCTAGGGRADEREREPSTRRAVTALTAPPVSDASRDGGGSIFVRGEEKRWREIY